MIHSIKQALTLSVPLTLTAHHHAQLFYQRYRLEPHKARQVYLNALAVEAVRIYLGWMGIECDLQASDSWNPIIQTLADVADLEVSGQGKLECRPVLPRATTCYIPPETNADRIGYLPVRLNTDLTTATLLGFMPGESIIVNIDKETSTVPLESFRPITSLFDRVQASPIWPERRTILGQWLKGAVESSWQTVETLLDPLPGFSFRSIALFNPTDTDSAIVRGKLIELALPSVSSQPQTEDIQSADRLDEESRTFSPSHYRAALIVGIEPNDSLQLNVQIKLCPAVDERYLLEDLKLRVRDAQGIVVMEAQARQVDRLQLDFRGIVNERFTVEVALDNVTWVEEFTI